jgi:SPP1 family predicted phage head-tail adaptor
MMREPVQFQRLTRTSDGAGGYTEAWAAVSGAPVRAMVKAMSGRERWSSQRIEASSTHRVVVRYFDGLREGDRVEIRGEVGNLRFVNNVGYADRWLEIDVEMGVAT